MTASTVKQHLPKQQPYEKERLPKDQPHERERDDGSCARALCTEVARLHFNNGPCTGALCTEIAGIQYDGEP